jgi:hypothetical protein
LPGPWHRLGTLHELQGVGAEAVANFDDFHGGSPQTFNYVVAVEPSQPDAQREPGRSERLRPNFRSLVREYLFYLLQVIDVVPGKHAHDVPDSFATAFGMHSIVLPLLGRERFK